MRLYLTRPRSNIKAVALIDKKHIHNNRLQVINQYEETEGKHTHAMMCQRTTPCPCGTETPWRCYP